MCYKKWKKLDKSQKKVHRFLKDKIDEYGVIDCVFEYLNYIEGNEVFDYIINRLEEVMVYKGSKELLFYKNLDIELYFTDCEPLKIYNFSLEEYLYNDIKYKIIERMLEYDKKFLIESLGLAEMEIKKLMKLNYCSIQYVTKTYNKSIKITKCY